MNQSELKSQIKVNLSNINWSSFCIKDCVLDTNQIIMKSNPDEREHLKLKNNIQFLQKHTDILQTRSIQLVNILCDDVTRQLFKSITRLDLGMVAYVAAGISELLEQYLTFVCDYKYRSKEADHNLQIESDSVHYLYTKLSDELATLKNENLF